MVAKAAAEALPVEAAVPMDIYEGEAVSLIALNMH